MRTGYVRICWPSSGSFGAGVGGCPIGVPLTDVDEVRSTSIGTRETAHALRQMRQFANTSTRPPASVACRFAAGIKLLFARERRGDRGLGAGADRGEPAASRSGPSVVLRRTPRRIHAGDGL